MRKSHSPLIVGLVVAVLAGVLATGCGSSGTSKQTSPLTAPKSKTGSDTTGTVVPTEAELGVPVYPGARMDENSALTTTDASGKKEVIAAQMWTGDGTDAVITWYKNKLSGKPEFKEMPVVEAGKNSTILAWKEGDKYKMITIGPGNVDHQGQTVIGLGAGSPPVPGGGQ
jgi:hypothetical protein